MPTIEIRKISGAEAPARLTISPAVKKEVERRRDLRDARHDHAEQAELAVLQRLPGLGGSRDGGHG
jgi:hypothetical protein